MDGVHARRGSRRQTSEEMTDFSGGFVQISEPRVTGRTWPDALCETMFIATGSCDLRHARLTPISGADHR